MVSRDTGAQQTLVRGTDGAVTVSGHLVFGRDASLWAVPFDPERLTVSGGPTPDGRGGIIGEDDAMDAGSLPRVDMPHRDDYKLPEPWTPDTRHGFEILPAPR